MELDTKCIWKADYDDVWNTDCGNAFIFEEGTPSDNGFNFCPYCGRDIGSVEYTDPEFDEEIA